MRIQYLISAALTVATATACMSKETTAPVDPGDPVYSVAVSGDRVASMHGTSFTQRLANGYTEVDQSGHSQSTNVVLVLLSSIDFNPPTVTIGPQVNLGLMGVDLVPGTYSLHTTGSAVGTKPEFYGSFTVTNSDSTRTEYQATSGTVTITSVSPKIQGTFSFHSSRALLWPSHVGLHEIIPSTPGSLDASGSFVARVP